MKPAATTVKSTRAKSHKPVKADNAIGVPATGSAPIVAIMVDTVPEPDSKEVSTTVVDINNQTEDQTMNTNDNQTSAPADNQINNQTEGQTDTDTDKATIARLTEDLAVARADLAEAKKTIDATPTALDVLTSLFKGDKSVHATALTALVKLAHTKDAEGKVYPEVTRAYVGEIVNVGIWRGIAIMAKGHYNHESDAFDLGKKIAFAAHKAAESGKEDSKAQKKAAGLLNLATILPDLCAGLRLQHTENRREDAVQRPRGIDKAVGSNKAHARFTAIEDAEKTAPVLVKIKEAGAMA